MIWKKKREHERSMSPRVCARCSDFFKTMMIQFHKANMLCNSGTPRTKSGSPKRGHQNQVPASRSQYQPNTIRALDYKQPHSYITGQNRLQTPGAPTRSALGPTSVSSPS
ncbi:hypothetical protein M9H77_32717 [Catharanthus roseus]|uniref:Uncharacterized protein n=1 Tax=Catharanthus roseus TaxID=4058 RepID=A0ACC0A556_CATRO|nr:hypothetical protein M9H77_32717 [Catharanthus roseus]